jgi:hypothetical protein
MISTLCQKTKDGSIILENKQLLYSIVLNDESTSDNDKLIRDKYKKKQIEKSLNTFQNQNNNQRRSTVTFQPDVNIINLSLNFF